MRFFDDILEKTRIRRERDARRFAALDSDLCMLCGAYGADKRSLFVECGYAVEEAVPEAIDLFAVENEALRNRGYYLLLCKSCRGALLQHMQEWRNERVALRGAPKDHDGYDWLDDEEIESMVPVLVNDVPVFMTPEQYAEYQEKRAAGLLRVEVPGYAQAAARAAQIVAEATGAETVPPEDDGSR